MNDDCKRMLDILEKSNLNNLIECFRNVYVITHRYGIEDETYIGALNNAIEQTILSCEESGIYGFGWVNYFDEVELLEEILIVNSIPPYDFVNSFHKYSDYDTSEIRDIISRHCNILNEDPNDYYQYL